MGAVKLGKGYSSVNELFESEFGPMSPEEKTLYQKEEFEQTISQTLFNMRVTRNVSREELAKKMQMTVDDIIRIESDGTEVKWNEAIKYAAFLGFKPKIRFEYQEPLPVAEITVTVTRDSLAREPSASSI